MAGTRPEPGHFRVTNSDLCRRDAGRPVAPSRDPVRPGGPNQHNDRAGG